MDKISLLQNNILLYENRLRKAAYPNPYVYAIKCLNEELNNIMSKSL